jgi:fermentation-respiration switch protein FrsA (DUF1100 family)
MAIAPFSFLHRISSMLVIKSTCLIFVFLLGGCTNLIFQPTRQFVITPDAIGVAYEDIHLKADDGVMLHGWRLYSDKPASGTILFFHGNGENISTHMANVYWLVDEGYDVLMFDYRGYGKSQGLPDLDLIVKDAQGMIGYAVEHSSAGTGPIIIGHSFGASLSIYAVAHSRYKDRIRALVSIAAFSDYHEVAQDVLSRNWLFWLFQWPLSFTIDDSYSPLESVAEVSPVPLLLMHSRQDEMIDYHHVMALFDAAAEPKTLITVTGDHNHVFNLQSNRKLLMGYLRGLKKTAAQRR